MNNKLDNINLTEEEKGVIEQRLKSKKRKQRTAKFLLSFFALTSLSSCSTHFGGLVPDWFKAMTNQDTSIGEDEQDFSYGIGARFNYASDNNSLSFKDVFEENIKSMDAHSYIYDYFEIAIIGKETKVNESWNVREICYMELGLTEDDFIYNNGDLLINESGGEKLKNNPEIINLWYYNSSDKYQPSYYLPYIIIPKEDWKNVIRPEMYSWFISKVKEEQDAILLTNNTNWALKNYSGDLDKENIQNIDLATPKGYIPYKLGTNFLINVSEQERNSFKNVIENIYKKHTKSLSINKKDIGNIQYLYYGRKSGYGNSSLAFNNSILESKYIEFPTSYLLEDNMQYDDYRSIMLTTKRNIAINSISYDIEFYNVANENYVSTLTNKTQSIFGMEVGEFRLEQVDKYKEYSKRWKGLLVGSWLANQNAFNCGTNYFDMNYIFEEKGQTKYWKYCTEEEQANYYFEEGQTYHIEIDGVSTSLIGSEDEWTKERSNEFRLVIPKGCNLNLKIELNGKNAYSFYKIKNLKIDYDVVDSWTYIEKNTLAWIGGFNTNYIYKHY